MSDSTDRARRLAETVVQALLDELARKGGWIETTDVVWVPPEEAPAQRNPSPSRQTIRAFLETALADGAVAVRDLEAKARAAMLLASFLPISQCKPFRRVADDLHVLRFRDDDRSFWELPKTGEQDARKMPTSTEGAKLDAQVPDAETIARALRSFLAERRKWNGRSSQLLAALRAHGADWPADPKAFSAALRNSADQLRNAGVTITFG